MIDFSKIFDIVFASVGVALMLFLLISTIAVAARGKRKCGGFDVFLRIVATLVLIVAAVMFAAAILTMLTGSFRIMLVSEASDKTVAYLVMNGKQIALPLVDLFIVLSSVVGSNLVAMLLICALAALIVDCVVANKKDGKKSKQKKVAKTPAQFKREAELERIRRLGESAVRKADAAASKETATTEEQLQSDEGEPQTDWREERPQDPPHTDFVGIKDADEQDDFDSFDDIPSDGNAQDEETTSDEQEYAEQYTDEQTDGQEPLDEFAATQTGEEQAAYADESDYNGNELTEEASAEQYDNASEYSEDEYTEQAESEAEQSDYDELEQEQVSAERELEEEVDSLRYDESAYEQTEESVAEQTAEDVANAEDDMSNWAYESDEHEQSVAATHTVVTETVTTTTTVVERTASVKEQQVQTTADDVEPDRNIYFPEMRTIEPTPKKAMDDIAQAAKKPSSTPKAKPAAKPKKPAAKKQKSTTPPEKKLPMTRKYVILDRHNAVNMFGEYLKERNRAQKEKLESSIDTIIIE